MTHTVVHLLRHGEVHNPAKVLYGRLPGYRLSELGERMAEEVAKSLAGRDITYVVSSPLERAVQTARPSADLLGLPIAIDTRLIESENWFEGRRVAGGEGALRDPRAWLRLINPFRPSWGEPYSAIAQRMRQALLAARERTEGHEALCVSHQLPIWTLRRSLAGKPLWHDPRKRQCSLASLTSFRFAGDRLVGIDYAEPAARLGPGVGKGA
jgi:broad specificity phosphatase PhoE